MLPKAILTFAAMLAAVSALPNKPVTTTTTRVTTTKHSTTTTKWATSTKPTSTTQSATTTSKTTSASPAPTNNGGVFINQCQNYGISIADCTSLLNIAALNGNTIIVGGSGGSGGSSAPVNNGLLFLNQCKNVGISVLDCAELLNIALLNGNTIDINLQAVVSLLAALGVPTGILGGLLPTGTGLITLPTGLL